MYLYVILAILAALMIFIVMKLMNGKPKSKGNQYAHPDAAQSQSGNAGPVTIRDAQNGDTVSVPGFGDEFDDLDFTVDRRNRYETGNDSWFEVSGLYRGRRVHVEVREDDEVEVFVNSSGRELSLSDLGITEDQLGEMDENEDYSASFDWDGSTWSYASSYEIGYFKNGQGEGEGYYNWQFSSQDRLRQISIEKWEDEPFNAIVSRCANPRDVRVFRGSA